MPIAFSCPYCQRDLRAFDHLVGRVLTCPGCRKPFNVPALGQGTPPASFVDTVYLGPRLTVLPPQPAPAPVAAVPVETSPGLGTVAAVGGVAALGAVAAVAAVAASPSKLMPPAPPPDDFGAPELPPDNFGSIAPPLDDFGGGTPLPDGSLEPAPEYATAETAGSDLPPPGAEFEMGQDQDLSLDPAGSVDMTNDTAGSYDQAADELSLESAPAPEAQEMELTDDMLVPGDAAGELPPADMPADSAFEPSFEMTEDGAPTGDSAGGEDLQLMEDIFNEESDPSAQG